MPTQLLYLSLHMLQLLQKNGYWGKLTFALTQVLGILILGRSNHCWRRRNPSIFFTQRAFLINSEKKRYTSKVGSSRWLNFKLLLQAALHSFPVKIWRHEIFFLLQQNVWISMVTKTDLPGKKLSFNRVEQLSVQHTPQCKQASQTRGRTHQSHLTFSTNTYNFNWLFVICAPITINRDLINSVNGV